MAQELIVTSFPTPRQRLQASNVAVAVAQTGNTEVLKVPCFGIDRLYVHVGVADQALDAFIVRAYATLDAAADTLFSLSTDYTNPAGILVGASGDLTTLAAAATGWLVLDVRGISQIDILASSGNVAGSAVTVYAGGA